MARGTAAKIKAAQMKARSTAARARERYKSGEVKFGTGVIMGGAAAGALDGYGLDFEVGGYELGYALPVGAALVLGDGFGNKMAKGAGYGMLASEVAMFVSDLVADMLDDDEDDDDDDEDDDENYSDDED